ncbi:unnamed protein product [Adineta steineri]|uniref:Apple domain-containing protein n=1 Tax=Adineta steineri TaxID=433720 RepID=A0A819X4X1_9BILA|nr:unnamed protein product [Adineta steineri]
MVERRNSLFIVFVLVTQLAAQDIRSVYMSKEVGWQFQCSNTTCLPFATVAVSNIINCQVACLAQVQCNGATFYRSSSNCELFANVSNQNGNLSANMDTVTMIVIDGTRIPLATTSTSLTTISSTSSSTTSLTTNSSTTSSTTTTTTTTPFNSCNNLRWNQTGQIVAGTISGSNANQLKNPSCLYIDNNNTLYICDYDNNRVQRWFQGGATGVTVAGSSTGTQGSTSTLLRNPIDLTFDENGFMYVVDSNNNRVQRFAPNSTNGTTVVGTTGSTNALTGLNQPSAIDIDNNSNIYILDIGNTRLVEWAQNATNGTLLISDNSLNNDYDILLVPNSSNQIYISNQGGHAIYLWTFGASSPSMTLQTVNDSQNTLNNPTGIVLDPYGNLYVADRFNHRVVMYCVNSTVGIVVAEDNNSVPSLQEPVALAFDSDLNLYVLTRDNGQVVKLPRI